MKWRHPLSILGVSLGCLFLAGLTTCIPVNRTSQFSAEGPDSLSIFVINHGYHTSIVLPGRPASKHWAEHFPELPDQPGFYQVAWGDRDYFTGNAGILNGLKALFIPTDGVMLINTFSSHPCSRFNNVPCIEVRISQERFEALFNWIDDSFLHNKKGKPLFENKGYYRRSAFYRSKGHYTFLFNCNNWINRGLQVAGVKTPLWGGLPSMVLLYLPEE